MPLESPQLRWLKAATNVDIFLFLFSALSFRHRPDGTFGRSDVVDRTLRHGRAQSEYRMRQPVHGMVR